MESELFLKVGGRSVNVILRFGKGFFFAEEGKVFIQVGRSKFATLDFEIVGDFDEERSFEAPDVSYGLD